MPSKVWAIGEEVLAADFNPYVQEQVLATFPSYAARDAAIGAPKAGQACYIIGTGELLIYAGTAWRRPWNMPWGIVYAGPPLAANSTAIAGPGNIPGMGTTLAHPANRKLRLTCHGQLQNDTLGAEGRFGITVDAVNVVNATIVNGIVNRGIACTAMAYYDTPNASSHAYQATMARSAGAGLVLTNAGSWFSIEDVGPVTGTVPATLDELPVAEQTPT